MSDLVVLNILYHISARSFLGGHSKVDYVQQMAEAIQSDLQIWGMCGARDGGKETFVSI